MGISGAALAYMDNKTLAEATSNPEDEVPRLERLEHTNHEAILTGDQSPEREAIYYTLPKDEWAHIEGSIDAMHNTENLLRSELESFDGIRVSVREQNGSTRNRIISVKYTEYERADGKIENPEASREQVQEILPDMIEGAVGGEERDLITEDFPIEIVDAESRLDFNYEHRYRDPGVPGGAALHTCTSGTPAYNFDDGRYHVTTAGHCTEEKGETFYQPDEVSTDIIGQVYDRRYWGGGSGPVFDAATIQLADSVDHHYDLASNNGDNSYRNLEINGIYAWDAIKDGIDKEFLGKQGKTTGIDSGLIREVYEAENDPYQKSFEIDADRAGGDSGGPHYRETGNNTIVIAGLHHGVLSDSGYAGATAMEPIEELFNMSV